MGLWLVIFLMEHLLVNSQAALFFGDDGSGFISSVQKIKDLPYLPVIELGLLGFPIAIHLIWGIEYLRTGKINSYKSDGTTPSLPEYSRNQAYTWQRITSYILLFALIGHIVHMRFIEYPDTHTVEGHHTYKVRVTHDEGLADVAKRLDVRLENDGANNYVAISPNFGTAELMMVRETFKMPIMIALYTVFVLAACYHGFNGLWTFLITWGICLTERSQMIARRLATTLLVLISSLGLAAIWLTYWINLKQ